MSAPAPTRIIKCWRDHSLTIVLTLLGLLLTGLGVWHVWPLENDRWFDIWSGLGAGTLTVALFNWLSGPLRERNKPEE
jgi:thiol:disulfide interchange protein